ncbi:MULTISPECIES: polyphenol oxidase family protein [unclassified Campylobacter]|uniref:polyphenol oxidase family protein n=1 Tax=unclassified Campylobacter TaxID=2593542 RepID=UPI0022E9B500|nr:MULTISPECIES: polyphenol oxidase family protein [unclassified Campylobacter]MDA3056140.1 polyphenol oxidase family protein [Campylobacter sp. CN_NA1]MDA3065285.1 polyphenol oxidase family protein [Campylobacter sp. CN_NE4]MDA3068110.1 polyphenol oxidase family protein [Campylobacter sp. CN_NE3]MDA3082738.1 polyphenol oxidase family protein [Campylobacter sp. CN_EL2]MDA3083523.1 polyphenol oxidase family protein [Campylobacter sp. CN_NE1]
MGSGEFDFKPLLNAFKFGFTDKFGLADAIFKDTAPKNLNGENLGKFGKFNLAFHVGDDFKSVLQNRLKMANLLGLELQNLIFMNQIHSDKICVVDEKFMAEFGAKFDKFFEFGEFKSENLQSEFVKIFPECDAMITNLKGVGLCVMVADCSPVLLLDEKSGAVGVAHAGRAGVTQKIVTKTALKMSEIYGTKICDLSVIVGANIRGSCYEVSDLDLGEFNAFKRGDKFDMNLALKSEFSELGIKKFKFSKFCTHCENSLYSYRREKQTGRFCGFVVKND